MIKLKTAKEIRILREAGQKLRQILLKLAAAVKPGVTTDELDRLARQLIAAADGTPVFLGYRPAGAARPYPAALCVSVNEEIVHGLPGERQLVVGDLVSLDLGLKYQGLIVDSALTVPVGEVSAEARELMADTENALALAIKAAGRKGAHLGDIGAAVETLARTKGYGLVKELGGHGVGYQVHEEPLVPNYGRPRAGLKLLPGMVLALEPMLALGTGEVKLLPDGFTYATKDGTISAHFEHTIAITRAGAEILTN